MRDEYFSKIYLTNKSTWKNSQCFLITARKYSFFFLVARKGEGVKNIFWNIPHKWNNLWELAMYKCGKHENTFFNFTTRHVLLSMEIPNLCLISCIVLFLSRIPKIWLQHMYLFIIISGSETINCIFITFSFKFIKFHTVWCKTQALISETN